MHGSTPVRLNGLLRAAVALGVAVTATWIPIASAHACSCGFAGYPEAIGDADFAFVGTVVGVDEPERPVDLAEAAYTFDIAVSKEPMASPFTVLSWFGNDANCGFDMEVGEEWLVIAFLEEGRPTTNLCTGSSPVTALNWQALAAASEVLTVQPAAAAPNAGATEGPEPVAASSTSANEAVDVRLLIAGAIAAVATIGLVASVVFARRRPGRGAAAS